MHSYCTYVKLSARQCLSSCCSVLLSAQQLCRSSCDPSDHLFRLTNREKKSLSPLSVSVTHVPPSRSPDHGTKSCRNVLPSSLALPTKKFNFLVPSLSGNRVYGPQTQPLHFPLPHPNIVDLGTCEAVNTIVGCVPAGVSHFGQECRSTLS